MSLVTQQAKEINMEDLSKRALAWVDGFKLSPEHILMMMMVAISTAHVYQFMHVVEGNWAVAVIMGLSLGALNIFFSFRFFESDGPTRWPARTGLLLSVIVSVYMQYSFYDTNKNLTAYFWGWFNIAAFLSGLWAPLFEIILGWLYGVRVWVVNEQNDQITQVVNKWKADLKGVSDKYEKAIVEIQDGLYREHDLKEELRSYAAQIEQMRGQLNSLTTNHAVLNERLKIEHRKLSTQAPANVLKPTGKLSTGNRITTIEQMRDSGQLSGYNVSSLADHLNCTRNTLRKDLNSLNIVLSTQETAK